MKPELLAPAGTIEAFKQAIFNGADAVYLATEKFGARAYAKNLTIDELKEALRLAHPLNKKIYVTVNTILKENEVEECKKYLNTLYELGVDGVILADFAMINYVINNLNEMEAHISTQCGVKDLNDVLFFEKMNAKRCVIARENSIESIKNIKSNSNMPLEVFAYGALCVSYSGGCLFSSLLSLRSGNRGRCAQNCRREYQIFKNGEQLAATGYHLSMRDLNTANNFKDFIDANVDSLKIEGRMKSPEYVKIVTSELRKKLDNVSYNPAKLDTVFHRNYTNGFVFNEDNGQIVDEGKKSNEGAFIGEIGQKQGKLTELILNRNLNVNDRIRIEDDEDYYFTIDKMYNSNLKEIKEASKSAYVLIYKNYKPGTKIFKMIDSTIDLTISNSMKIPLIISCFGNANDYLLLKTKIGNKNFTVKSNEIILEAQKQAITYDSLFKQLNKLVDTPFYLKKLDYNLSDDCFMPIKEINETRRLLIKQILDYYQNERKIKEIKEDVKAFNFANELEIELVAKCQTLEQYNTLKEMGITTIYYENYIPYVNAKYQDIKEDYILAGNYGAINYYENKKITADYSFNTLNSEAIYDLLKAGCNNVCLSLETDKELLKEIATGFEQKYNAKAPIEFVCYGHQNLMTMKYCPLKRFKQCGQCKNNTYMLKDNYGAFYLTHTDCISHILNEKSLNLVDELDYIKKYASKIRMDFTIENKEEVKQIVNMFKNKLNNTSAKKEFNANTQTRGYYLRPIL